MQRSVNANSISNWAWDAVDLHSCDDALISVMLNDVINIIRNPKLLCNDETHIYYNLWACIINAVSSVLTLAWMMLFR